MKATWTSGKRKKSNYKLNNIKLNCEPGELVLVSSLSDLNRKENLEKFQYLSSHDFTEKVGIYGDCHLFNAVFSNKDEFFKKNSFLGEKGILEQIKEDANKNYIERHSPGGDHDYSYNYLFDNDQDGMIPNIHKVSRKSNSKKISFFVNPSNISTSDFIDEAIQLEGNHGPWDGKLFKIKNNDLVFCCIPETENRFCKTQFKKNEIKNFSSDMSLFIKDRIKKKKLIKFKVPNGVYGIYKIIKTAGFFEDLPMPLEHGELLGHYIKRFNPEIGTIGWERKKRLRKRKLKKKIKNPRNFRSEGSNFV